MAQRKPSLRDAARTAWLLYERLRQRLERVCERLGSPPPGSVVPLCWDNKTGLPHQVEQVAWKLQLFDCLE
ncbi:hypothetical protein LC607_31005 [Nostoc sp. CHAB 5824]|nr:hypothetical protein [Nostoc sp. CHAB 5824]